MKYKYVVTYTLDDCNEFDSSYDTFEEANKRKEEIETYWEEDGGFEGAFVEHRKEC